MEDKTLAVNFEMNGHNFSLFGIYDGHGGEEIAQLVKDEFLQILQAELQTCDCSNNALKKALTNAYLKMDEKCLEKEKELNGRTVGSCALTALIVDGQLQIANAGDSRAVIFNNNSAMRLSKDHNAKYKDCQDEVEEKGCQV